MPVVLTTLAQGAGGTPSVTEIVNIALGHIAAQPISDLSEPNTRSQLAARLFQQTADECLADHDWNFARRRSPALAEVDVPSFEWRHAFQLPSEPYCLVVRATDGDVDKESWTIEGRLLLTDLSTMKIRYTARIVDTGLWSPHFVTAYTYLLASKLAYPITKSLNVSQDMFKVYESRLSRARTANGLEAPARSVRSTTLTDVR